MKLHFKHEDTRLVVGLTAIFALVASLAAIAIPGAAEYVVLGYVLIAVIAVQLHLYRRSRIDAVADRVHIQDLLWLHGTGVFDSPLPPLTGWAAEPGLVATLQSIVQRRRPALVVEFGSGASTVVVAHALKRIGSGSIISFDHDEQFAAKTRRELERRDLAHVATIRHSPLGPVLVHGIERKWYQHSVVDDERTIDLLIVDGPPLSTTSEARYPALPLFHKQLSSGAMVVLHDLYREEEQRIVSRWLSEFKDFDVDFVETPKRIAILSRRDEAAA